MKKMLLFVTFFVTGFLFSLFDALFPDFCVSLIFVVWMSLFSSGGAVVISTLCGMFIDFLNYSAPFYTFIYLYISLGCVWCKNSLFKVNFLTFFVVCVVSLLLDFAFSGNGTLVNVVFSPIFYLFLKRVL